MGAIKVSDAVRIDQRESFGHFSTLDRFTSGTVLLSLHGRGHTLNVIWHADPDEWADFYDAVIRLGRGIEKEEEES